MSNFSTKTDSKELSTPVNQTLGNIQDQLATYGAQIQDYLKNLKADISDYKFAVEKTENGLDIDVRFKAEVRLEETGESTTTRSSAI